MAITINGTTGIAGVDGSAGTPAVQGADTNTGVFFPAADTIGFAEGGAEVARFDSSGNLGLSVTPSAWSTGTALQVKRASFYTYDNSGVEISQNAAVISGAWQRIGADFATKYGQDTGNHYWYTAASSTAGSAITWSERARITSNGEFLVGTTATFSPGGVGSANGFSTGTSTKWVLGAQNTNSTSPWGIGVKYSATSPNTNSYGFLFCEDNVGTRAYLYSNGGLANYSGNNVNLSDRREKINFAPSKNYLDTICAIPVQTFNYIDQNMEEDAGLTLGVVAQDVQEVAPEFVSESNWGTQEEPKMRLSIYQTDLQYALMKCIQELKAELDTAKSRIAALEAK
jgi:hypothetical protein